MNCSSKGTLLIELRSVLSWLGLILLPAPLLKSCRVKLQQVSNAQAGHIRVAALQLLKKNACCP